MLNLDKYQNELKDIFATLPVDEYYIELVPGMINNNDKPVDVIKVLIEHKATKKSADYLYRHGHHQLKPFLTDCVKDFEKRILTDILTKPENSL